MNKRKEGGEEERKKEGFLVVREATGSSRVCPTFEDEKNGIWVVKGGHARDGTSRLFEMDDRKREREASR